MDARRSEALRLTWITDGRGDARRILGLAESMIAGGLRAIQVRERSMPTGALHDLCRDLAARLDAVAGVLLVNDRADVAARACHGLHLPVASWPPRVARELVGPERIVGCAAHDRVEVEAAVLGGADYVMVSPVFPTASKPGAPALGPEGASRLAHGAAVPALWLGGMTPERVRTLGGWRPFGIAAMSAMTNEPEATTREFLAALREARR